MQHFAGIKTRVRIVSALLSLVVAAAFQGVASGAPVSGGSGFWARDRISRCPTAPIKRPPHNRDERFRPVWIVVRRGNDFNNGGTKWIWPKRPEFPEPRLQQSRLTGDNFARLEIEE